MTFWKVCWKTYVDIDDLEDKMVDLGYDNLDRLLMTEYNREFLGVIAENWG
jgi:hypothetical protein